MFAWPGHNTQCTCACACECVGRGGWLRIRGCCRVKTTCAAWRTTCQTLCARCVFCCTIQCADIQIHLKCLTSQGISDRRTDVYCNGRHIDGMSHRHRAQEIVIQTYISMYVGRHTDEMSHRHRARHTDWARFTEYLYHISVMRLGGRQTHGSAHWNYGTIHWGIHDALSLV